LLPDFNSFTTAICWKLLHYSWQDPLQNRNNSYLPMTFAQQLNHKSRACIPNFKSIQINLITQTWFSSQLTQIFNIEQISILELYFIKYESNLKSTCMNTFTRYKSIQSTYQISSYEFIHSNQLKIWFQGNKSIQTCHSKQHMHIYPIQSTHMHPNKWDQLEIYLG
jgi:hypothetical protein